MNLKLVYYNMNSFYDLLKLRKIRNRMTTITYNFDKNLLVTQP